MKLKVKNPTHGVLKKRVTDHSKILISVATKITVQIGKKLWTPDGVMLIAGGSRGKVFVTPVRKGKNPYTRKIAPEILGMRWVTTDPTRGEEFMAIYPHGVKSTKM